MNVVSVGNKAPDFELPSHLGGNISLSNYYGKWVILAFYPKDDSMVCTKELCSYDNYISDFKNMDAHVLGINTDCTDSHKRFAKKQKINFHLLTDKGGTVSKIYNVFYSSLKRCKRGVFLIDPLGITRYKYIELTPLTYRNPKELLEKVRIFQNREICK